MIITAKGLKLRNVGQLVEFVHNGIAVMGRVDNVMIHTDGSNVALRIAGCGKTFNLAGDHMLNIMRSAEAYEAFQGTLALEDILNSTEKANAR